MSDAETKWTATVPGRAGPEPPVGESEDRLRIALEAGRMGTWRYDLATGEQQWSEQQFRLYGLEPDGAVPSRELFLSLVHPDDLRLVTFGEEDLQPGRGLLDSEFRIVRPGGEVRWLVAHTAVRRAADGRPLEMIGVNWDITERHRAEQDLRNSEEGLRLALEAGQMGTYRFDVRTGVESWSDSEYALLGLARDAEPPTRDLFLSLVHPDDLHLVQFTADDSRSPGTPLNSEFRVIRPDTGEVRHLTAHARARFDADGHTIEVIGVNRDVTDERRAEAALRTSEQRLQQFSEASSDVLWIRDARTMQWEYLSPAFDRIYGLTRQDAIGADNYRTWLERVSPSDRSAVRQAIDDVAHGNRVVYEFWIDRPDGGRRCLRNTAFPIRDAAGAVTHIAGVSSDITALREANEHQQVLLSELQHRVRNTLSVIRSIARRTAQTSASVEDYAMKLEGRIDAFARVQSAVTRDPGVGIELAAILAEEMRAASLREGEGLTAAGPAVRLNAGAAETIGLALHELATNAIKYGALTVPHGRISVAWAVDETGPSRLLLEWRESGVTRLAPPNRRGLGTETIERILAYELGATGRMDFTADGLQCHIELPLDRILALSPSR